MCNDERMLRMILLGSSGCGKTTIANILTANYNFTTKDYKMTQGVDLFEKKFVIGEDQRVMNVILIDTSGHPLYSWIVDRFIGQTEKTQIFLFCFDFTNRQSFDSLANLISTVTSSNPNTSGVIVGCKSDLLNRQVVTNDMAKEFATTNKMKLISTSTRMTTAEMEAVFRDIIADSCSS